MKHNKKLLLVVSLVLLLTMTVGGTLAFLVAETDSITNIFNPSKVTCEVVETVNPEGTEKTDVMVHNTSDTEAYIRAAIVINWADGNGNIYGEVPVDEFDYDIDHNTAEYGWVKAKDGFYYWSYPVAANDNDATTSTDMTGVLIESVKLKDGKTAPEGYALSVEILCSAIQSVPDDAVEAWSNNLFTIGVDPNGKPMLVSVTN